jgi:hypothetical protein
MFEWGYLHGNIYNLALCAPSVNWLKVKKNYIIFSRLLAGFAQGNSGWNFCTLDF